MVIRTWKLKHFSRRLFLFSRKKRLNSHQGSFCLVFYLKKTSLGLTFLDKLKNNEIH